MNKLPLLMILCGCAQAKEISISNGEYQFVSLSGLDEMDLPTDITLTISNGSMSIAVEGQEVANGNLTTTPREEWLFGCATNFASVTLKTQTLDSSVEFGEFSFALPTVSPGCSIEEDGSEHRNTELFLFDNSDAETGIGPCPGLVCMHFTAGTDP